MKVSSARKSFCIKTEVPSSSRISDCGKYNVLAEQKTSNKYV
jgi:hypothetical protein